MAIQRAEMDRRIRQILDEIQAAKPEGPPAPPMTEETVLLDSGLDSLDFAILVTRLDDTLGFDPFSQSETAFYPQTYGALLTFYTDAQPR